MANYDTFYFYDNLEQNETEGVYILENIENNQGIAITEADSHFSYAGYYIDNWNTARDGSGIKYLPGDLIDNPETNIFYAIWKKPPKYLVTAEQLETVADAIRENCTRTDTKLSYPWGFIEGIEDDGEQYLINFLNGEISYVKCSVSYLSNYAFFYNSNIISVNFPACATIGSYAFYKCSNLTSISFPVCTTLGTNAFRECSNLTLISFPACTSIGVYAFRECHKLLSAYFLGSNIPLLASSNTFSYTPIANFTSYTSGEYGSIFVRASMLKAFKSATNWAYFSNRMVGLTDEEIANL